MRAIARFVLGLLGLLLSARLAVRVARRVAPGLVPAQTALLPVSPLQAVVFAPERLLPRVPLEPGMRVLQIGPSRENVVAAVVRAVGKYGRVYLVEPSPERAQALRAHLRAGRSGPVEVLAGGVTQLDLPDSTFDLVLLVGVAGGWARRERAFWELHRVLRPGGHLSLSEALDGADYVRATTLRREATNVGFVLRERRGSPVAYTLNFRKAG